MVSRDALFCVPGLLRRRTAWSRRKPLYFGMGEPCGAHPADIAPNPVAGEMSNLRARKIRLCSNSFRFAAPPVSDKMARGSDRMSKQLGWPAIEIGPVLGSRHRCAMDPIPRKGLPAHTGTDSYPHESGQARARALQRRTTSACGITMPRATQYRNLGTTLVMAHHFRCV